MGNLSIFYLDFVLLLTQINWTKKLFLCTVIFLLIPLVSNS